MRRGMNRSADNLLAIDIGNTAIKFGWFPAGSLPSELPTQRLELSSYTNNFDSLVDWMDQVDSLSVFVASVCRTPTPRLERWFQDRFPDLVFGLMRTEDFPISIHTQAPERVGHDRLAAAVCAMAIKRRDRPVIVVDAGSAITVDLVSERGGFIGGAILPGWQTMARTLRRETDQLPQLETFDFDCVPDAVGRFTEEAIASGLYWGGVGAVKELISRISATCDVAPDIMLTGGEMPSLARHMDQAVRCEPDLVLRGIAIAARQVNAEADATELSR